MEKDGFKKCSKCGEVKQIDEFYLNDVLRSGRANVCKYCAKRRREEYRKRNIKHVLKVDRERIKYIKEAVLKCNVDMCDKRMGRFDNTEEQKFDEMIKENEKKLKEYAEKNGIKLKWK